MTGRRWHLLFPCTLWTVNAERRMHWGKRAGLVRPMREAARVEALKAQIPRLQRLGVTATPRQARGRLADVAGPYPAVKAAVDGLVDAGILPDDSPEFLASLVQTAPVRSGCVRSGVRVDMLELIVEEVAWPTR